MTPKVEERNQREKMICEYTKISVHKMIKSNA